MQRAGVALLRVARPFARAGHHVQIPSLPRASGRRCRKAAQAWSRSFSTTAEAKGEGTTSRPTRAQLRRLFVHATIPMVAFGLVDQTVLIYMGDFIDNSIGVRFALPTLAAAAMGQVFSDTSGVLFGSTIESIALKTGLPLPGLSMAQQRMTITKVVSTSGATLGVITGCLVGMLNLLLLDLGAAERARRRDKLRKIMNFIMEDARRIVACERATLWMVDEVKGELWTAVLTSSSLEEIRVPKHVGVVGEVYTTGELRNVGSVCDNEAFVLGASSIRRRQIDIDSDSFIPRNILCAPVIRDGEVVALVQLLNNLDKNGIPCPFSQSDEQLIRMLTSHAALFMEEADI